MEKTYHLYISHSWQCHIEACKKKEIFLIRSGIKYKFIETFKHEAGQGEDEELQIEKAIKFSDVLLMIAGVDSKCDSKLSVELAFAQKHRKPVVSIAPWANKKTSELLEQHSDRIVGWHAKLLAEAIQYPYNK